MLGIRESFNRSSTCLTDCTIMVVHPYINNGERLIERFTRRVVGQAGGGRSFPALHARPGHETLTPIQILSSLKGR